MTDADLMLTYPNPEFGSGVIGVCDVCGKRQAVIVLQKERFKLCVIDFLNKKWLGSGATPGVPPPIYASERVWFPTTAVADGRAQAVVLSPTRVIKRPGVLVTPDVHGLTTALLDAAIRFARQGFEVVLPDVNLARVFGVKQFLAARGGVWRGGGARIDSGPLARVVTLYIDALAALRSRPLVDPERTALFGLSYGAAFAIALAGRDVKLSAVALADPVPVNPPAYLTLVTAPVLLVYGQKDRRGQRTAARLTPHLPQGRVEAVEARGAHRGFLGRDLSGYDLAAAEAAWLRVGEFLGSRLFPQPPRPPGAQSAVSSPAPPAPVAPPAAPPARPPGA